MNKNQMDKIEIFPSYITKAIKLYKNDIYGTEIDVDIKIASNLSTLIAVTIDYILESLILLSINVSLMNNDDIIDEHHLIFDNLYKKLDCFILINNVAFDNKYENKFDTCIRNIFEKFNGKPSDKIIIILNNIANEFIKNLMNLLFIIVELSGQDTITDICMIKLLKIKYIDSGYDFNKLLDVYRKKFIPIDKRITM